MAFADRMQTSSLDDYDPQVMVPSLQPKEAQPNREHKYGQKMTNLSSECLWLRKIQPGKDGKVFSVAEC